MGKDEISEDWRCEDRDDDLSIPDGEPLLRRLQPGWVKYDPEGPRCSSAAFKDRYTGKVSVFRGSMTTPAAVIKPTDEGLAEIEARVPRSEGFKVIGDPDPGDPGAAHAVICPEPKGNAPKRLARRTRIVVLRPRSA